MRRRGREVEDKLHIRICEQLVDRLGAQIVLGCKCRRSGLIQVGAGDRLPAVEGGRVRHIACRDDAAADDADSHRPAHRASSSNPRTARSELRDGLDGLAVDFVLLDQQPLGSGLDGRRQHALVADRSVADRHVLTAGAAAEVLQMHKGAAAGRLRELLDGIHTRIPDPAEVELEPEQLRGQLAEHVEECGAAGERLELGGVVVEAEPQADSGRCPRDLLDPRCGGGLRLDEAERNAVRAEYAQLVRQERQLGFEPSDARVGSYCDEADLVEPVSHLRRFVTVKLPELDTLVAQPSDAAKSSLEITLAIGTKRVEHQPHLQHAKPIERLVFLSWEGR